jgi:phage terminase small subunit
MKTASEPQSRNDIKEMALSIRRALHLEEVVFIDVIRVLEVLPLIFDEEGFEVEICSDREMEHRTHAYTDITNNRIVIKESIYDRAVDGKGRDRLTIAHELGHYFLYKAFGLKYTFREETQEIKTYEDPEWQAKCFAGEFLMPKHIIENLTIDEIVDRCGVSKDAATYQSNLIDGKTQKGK